MGGEGEGRRRGKDGRDGDLGTYTRRRRRRHLKTQRHTSKHGRKTVMW